MEIFNAMELILSAAMVVILTALLVVKIKESKK